MRALEQKGLCTKLSQNLTITTKKRASLVVYREEPRDQNHAATTMNGARQPPCNYIRATSHDQAREASKTHKRAKKKTDHLVSLEIRKAQDFEPTNIREPNQFYTVEKTAGYSVICGAYIPSETSFPHLEAAFRISVGNSSTEEKSAPAE